MASDKLWNWIDVHPEFGIGRPYLGKDPAHVALIDGRDTPITVNLTSPSGCWPG
jgi:hypothetical protein